MTCLHSLCIGHEQRLAATRTAPSVTREIEVR